MNDIVTFKKGNVVITMILLATVSVGFFISESIHRSKIIIAQQELNGRVEALEGKIVGRSPKGWHRQQMKTWTSDHCERNPDLICNKITDNWPDF